MTSKEFQVGERRYVAGRLSAFDQMALASDMRDVLMGFALLKRSRPEDMSEDQFRQSLELVFTGGYRNVSAEARLRCNRLVRSVVERRSGAGWAPITNAEGGQQFDDESLSDAVAMIYAVADHNGILDFFSAGPLASADLTSRRPSGPRSRTARTGS